MGNASVGGRSPFARLPVESDEQVFIVGYPSSGDIRVRFDGGGFVPEGLFRFAYHKMEDSDEKEAGPVYIQVDRVGDSVGMYVEITLKDGVVVKKELPAIVCQEILRRLNQMRSIQDTYKSDAPHTAVRKRRRPAVPAKNGAAHPAA